MGNLGADPERHGLRLIAQELAARLGTAAQSRPSSTDDLQGRCEASCLDPNGDMSAASYIGLRPDPTLLFTRVTTRTPRSRKNIPGQTNTRRAMNVVVPELSCPSYQTGNGRSDAISFNRFVRPPARLKNAPGVSPTS